MHPLTNLNDFLIWLSTGGGSMAALAFLVERIPAFQKLSANHKSLAILAGALVLALGSYTILTYVPPAILSQIAPIFAIVAGVAGAWMVGQGAHTVDPARIKSSRAETISAEEGEGRVQG